MVRGRKPSSSRGQASRRRNAPRGRRRSRSRPPAPPPERSPASRARPSAVDAEATARAKENQWNSPVEWFTLEGMNVRLYASPDGFGPVARWVYRRDPVRFTTELTTLRTSPWPTGHLLLSASDCDGTVGAALQMRDAVLLVNGLPPTVAKEAAAALTPVRADLPAIRGTPTTAAAFSQAWTEATGATATLSFAETLYRLGELVPPGDSPGHRGWPRTRTPRCSSDGSTRSSSRRSARRRIRRRRRDVLRDVADAGGQRRAVDRRRRTGRDGAGPRLTDGDVANRPGVHPTERRGHGYGATVTAEAVRHAQPTALATWCCSPTSPIRCRTGSTGGSASYRSASTCSTPFRPDDGRGSKTVGRNA